MHRVAIFLLLFVGFLGDCLLGQGVELVPLDANWRYFSSGLVQDTDWEKSDFDDSAWQIGTGPLGYGTSNISTHLDRPSGRGTFYFRTQFDVSQNDLVEAKALRLELRVDDGAVVYLNGLELRREYLPSGPVNFSTEAIGEVLGPGRFTSSVYSLSGLNIGVNTLAAEVHTSNFRSSDLAFGLILTADDDPFLGSSRPPCKIEFEVVEKLLGGTSGTGVRRDTRPGYTGLEYSYRSNSDIGALFRTSSEIYGNSPFDSQALAMPVRFEFESHPIDVSNYKDVRAALQFRTEGRIDRATEQFAVSLNYFDESFQSLTMPWILLKPKPDSDLVFHPLFAEDATVRYHVPTNPQIPFAEWTSVTFDDVGWNTNTLGIGYERSRAHTYDPFLGEDLQSELFGINSSVNFRVPFEVTEAMKDEGVELVFEMRYDDGFVAFLNGTEIARRNAPKGELAWNATATGTHSDSDAIHYEQIPIDVGIDALRSGTNILAVRGLNVLVASSDMLIQPRLSIGVDPGDEPPLTLDDFIGQFHLLETDLGLIPDSAQRMSISVSGTPLLGSAFYIDNIEVTGTPIETDSFPTAVALAGIEDAEVNPDPDGDGLSLLLEYAFGGEFLQPDDGSALLPQATYDELGFMTVRFRMLEGLTLGDEERGYDVEDLRYTPQLTYDLTNWRDGSGVPPFEQIGEFVGNGDGTVTVTLRSRRRLQTERGRAYFRMLVEVARPPGVILSEN